MGRIRITNLRGAQGLQGVQGPQGLPGVNAVPTDSAIAANLKNAAPTETQKASRRVSTPSGGLYVPTEYAAARWRFLRAAVFDKARQGHIAVIGDSIPAGTGAWMPSPKDSYNWPGNLRRRLAAEFGDAGSGIIIMDNDLVGNPTWDTRYSVSGTNSTISYGFYRDACRVLPPGTTSRIFVSAKFDELTVFSLPSSDTPLAKVWEGAFSKTIRNTIGSGPTPDVERQPDYKQIVSRVAFPSLATRTAAIDPPTTGTGSMYVLGVEARINTLGTFRVSNASVNGVSLTSLYAGSGMNDETNGFFGLPMIDMLRADLLIIALGINDWQAKVTIATLKDMLRTVIQRQRSSGAGRAQGDVLLLWNPQPDISTLQPTGGPTWEEYRQAYYDIADEQNCALLDMGLRYKDYATGNSLGMFGDGIHLGSVGSVDIVPAIRRAILEV